MFGGKNTKNSLKQTMVLTIIILLLGTNTIFPTARTTHPDEISLSQVFHPKQEPQKINCSFFGNIHYVGGTGPNNYSRIQEAINDADEGDTVYVLDDSSPYYENIVIDKKINLIGENKGTTIIDGGRCRDVIFVSADYVNISGFTIQNSGNDWIDAGIKLDSDHCMITDNIIRYNEDGVYSYDLENSVISWNIIMDNNNSGINLPFSSNNVITSNIFVHNKEYSLYQYDSELNLIAENNISNAKYGIYLWHSFQINIHMNEIAHTSYGIQLNHRSRHNEIVENTLRNNKYGIYLNTSADNYLRRNLAKNNKYGFYLCDSSYNELNGNVVDDNECGVYFKYSPKNNISTNKIENNRYGVYFNSSSNNNINRNNISKNFETGVYLCFNSDYNEIKYSNFLTNHVHAFFKQSFFNRWNRNHWDTWDGKGFHRINGEIFLLNGLITLKWLNFDFQPMEQPCRR
jgi:parallel beta-helix repeat protein